MADDAVAGSVAGLVLAAGAGRRMGGPKALLRLTPSGPTLVETAVARLHDAGVTDVHVVVGSAAPAVRTLAEGDGAVVVEAPDWDEGMGASLRRGLESLALGSATAALVMLVDLPDVGTEVHRRLLAAAAGADGADGAATAATAAGAATADGDLRAALVRAAYDGRAGHPVLLGRDHWAGVTAEAVGDRGARGYFASHEPRLVECGDLATGRDVDRPADVSGPAV